MKRIIFLLLFSTVITTGYGQDWLRILSGAVKVGQALTLSDSELADIVRKSTDAMDRENNVCTESSSYTKRLRRITQGMTDADGIPLNFKVYHTSQLNAFACPDGSVRIFSGLMDILSDDELLGVIGHEIGHVALRHSKKAWREELLRSAASDAIGAFSDTWANLSESVIGSISNAAISAKFSKKQEKEADDYGYEFLKECGRNPWAIALAFKKMKELSQKGEERYNMLLEAFSTHPNFDDRIKRIRKKAIKDGYPLE
jgi:putative metalloprotease